MVIRKTLTLEVPETEGDRETSFVEVRISTEGKPGGDEAAEKVWRDIVEVLLLQGQNRSLTVTEW